MIRSIRWRLQLWYALILASVIGGFGGFLYYRVRESRISEIDTQLESAALYLESVLQRFPPREVENAPDGLMPPPREGDERPFPPKFKGPPPRPNDRRPKLKDRPPRDRPPRRPPLEELRLPGSPESPFLANADRPAYFAVYRRDGTLLRSTPDPVDLPPEHTHRKVSTYWRGPAREVRLLGPHGSTVLVGKPMGRELDRLNEFGGLLLAVGGGVLVAGLMGGWLLSGRLLRPIAAISDKAAGISADNLDERIDTANIDRELADLAGVLNDMFGRLGEAFERQIRFTADASHELRTPLAIIRTHAELALKRPRGEQEYRDTLTTCLKAATRMTGLVEALLTLARADAGKLELRRKPVNLAAIVAENIDHLRPLAEQRNVTLQASLQNVEIHADADRLSQVMLNLLTNAIQYNRDQGKVVVSLEADTGQTVLRIADTGQGIAANHLPHLFERFYRVDLARTREAGGNGLGLSICKSIVEAHGGTIGVTSREGVGTTFEVCLPLAGLL